MKFNVSFRALTPEKGKMVFHLGSERLYGFLILTPEPKTSISSDK
jgi:hypothetical protein